MVKGNKTQIYQVDRFLIFFENFIFQKIIKKLDHLQNQYDLMKIKLDEALINKKTYNHMLDRMKVNKKFFFINFKEFFFFF